MLMSSSPEIKVNDIINKLMVAEGKKINLQKLDPDYDFSINEKKAEYLLEQNLKKRMSNLQYRLYAERKRALLIVFQGIDTSGKDRYNKTRYQCIQPTKLYGKSFQRTNGGRFITRFSLAYSQESSCKGRNSRIQSFSLRRYYTTKSS